MTDQVLSSDLPVQPGEYLEEVIGELVASDPAAAKIHASFSEFLKKSVENQRITEQAFLETRQ